MRRGAGSGSFGAHLKDLREAAGFTQEELATIAGLSVHAVSALERGERRRPQFDTLRALSAALDLAGSRHDAFVASAREPVRTAAEELSATALPVPLTPLFGRDAELHTVRQWLDGRAVRLVTLVGPGGVGKTRLALEIARATAADDTARVVFVSLAAAGNAALAAMPIAEGLGFSDITVSDLPRRARLACQDRATLLVLDNFEHVLDAAPLVSDLLVSVPPLQVLVTSRAVLRLRGEREYAVGPLALEHAGGNNDAALRWFTQSVDAFRALDVSWGVGNGLSGMAWVALTRADLDGADRLLDEAAPWLARAGPWFSELGLYIRAVMAVRRGNAIEAIRFVRESLTRILELQDKFAFVYALVPLASAAVLLRDDEWAARSLGARDAITERTGAALLDPSVNDLREQAERGARARLGPARWARAYETGRSASISGLLEEIDAALP